MAVIDSERDGPVENAVIAGDDQFLHVDIELAGDDPRDLIEQSDAVDAGDVDGGVEERLPVHIPFGVDDAVAETGFQFGGHITVAAVYLEMVLVVDEAQDVIAGNGAATSGKHQPFDIVVIDEERLFAVELLGDDERFVGLLGLVGIFLLLFLLV